MKPLTISDRALVLALQDEIRRTDEARYDHRLHAVLLVAQGQSCRHVAVALGDSPRIVQYWVNRFEQRGFAGLQEQSRPGRPRHLSDKQLNRVERVIRKAPYDCGLIGNIWDGKTLAAFIAREFDVSIGVRQCQRMFRQFGFRLRKPRPMIAHANEQLKSEFKKKLLRLANDPSIELWAEDEVHFQQHGSRCRMWVPPEVKRPILLHHPARKKVGYFGAVRLRDGKLSFQREEGKFNAETFFSFLRQLKRQTARSGKKVVLLLDNAKYHHALLHKAWRQQHQQSFQLLFLPPYSPDLNPIEILWKLSRRLCIHNRYFPELQLIVKTVESQFNTWTDPNRTVKKLCAII